jgi:hypothetical protein
MPERSNPDKYRYALEIDSAQEVVNDFEEFVEIVKWLSSEGENASSHDWLEKRTRFNSLYIKNRISLDSPNKFADFRAKYSKALKDLEEQNQV